MTELNLIIPCCIGVGCNYSNSLAEGYILGIITVIMLYVFIEVINIICENIIDKRK